MLVRYIPRYHGKDDNRSFAFSPLLMRFCSVSVYLTLRAICISMLVANSKRNSELSNAIQWLHVCDPKIGPMNIFSEIRFYAFSTNICVRILLWSVYPPVWCVKEVVKFQLLKRFNLTLKIAKLFIYNGYTRENAIYIYKI